MPPAGWNLKDANHARPMDLHRLLRRLHRMALGVLYPLEPRPQGDWKRLYADGPACARAILAARAVKNAYLALGVDVEGVRRRLAHVPAEPPPSGEGAYLEEVIHAGSRWHRHMSGLSPPVPLELCRLVGLLRHGSPQLRQALAPPTGAPGDLPFFVAHKGIEAELRSQWPAPGDQTGHVLLLNDPFSPMESVVAALQDDFAMAREQAIERMLEVHRAGGAALELPPDAGGAAAACDRLNAAWRSQGLPLYCIPQRVHGPSATSG